MLPAQRLLPETILLLNGDLACFGTIKQRSLVT